MNAGAKDGGRRCAIVSPFPPYLTRYLPRFGPGVVRAAAVRLVPPRCSRHRSRRPRARVVPLLPARAAAAVPVPARRVRRVVDGARRPARRLLRRQRAHAVRCRVRGRPPGRPAGAAGRPHVAGGRHDGGLARARAVLAVPDHRADGRRQRRVPSRATSRSSTAASRRDGWAMPTPRTAWAAISATRWRRSSATRSPPPSTGAWRSPAWAWPGCSCSACSRRSACTSRRRRRTTRMRTR